MADFRTRHWGLPLLLAALALAVYARTLSRGVTLNSLPLVASLAGWDDTPATHQPLVWLATGWLRLLPARWIPAAANAFSGGCAAAVLLLLARSIQLLPQNRHLLGRQPGPVAGFNRWLPQFAAVIVCGLEANFWQEAVAATGEMVDLVVFAAAIWCVLEYARNRRPVWLYAALGLWGMGIVENVGMLLLLPFFATGVFWLRCPERIDWRFLARMAGLLAAGSSLFLVLPVANWLDNDTAWSLSHAGLASLKDFVRVGASYYGFFWSGRLDIGLLLASYFLLPLLPLLILIKQEAGFHESRMGRVERLAFTLVNGICLAFCLWVTLDPCFDSWVVVKRDTGIFLPLLALIYLNACATGYLMQFWLLVTTAAPEAKPAPEKPVLDPTRWPQWLRRSPRGLLLILPLLMAALLAAKNLPRIRQLNDQPLTGLADLALRSLPPAGGVMLTDDEELLLLFKAVQAEQTDRPPCLPVNVLTLGDPGYRQKLERDAPAGNPPAWLADVRGQTLDRLGVLQLLGHAVAADGVYQPHPGSGFYFELFYQQPAGALYAMKIRDARHPEAPPLTAEELAAGERFWDRVWQTQLAPLARARFGPPDWLDGWLKNWLYVDRNASAQTAYLAEHYSIALDNWGVLLQRQGRLAAAARRFQQALDLSYDNTAANVNLENNTILQAGGQLSLAGVDSAVGQFGSIHELSRTISECGNFDDPVVGYLYGCILQDEGFARQAVEQFERVQELVPAVTAPQLALADLYAGLHRDDRVTATVEKLRALNAARPDNPAEDLHLSMLEANSWFAQTNFNRGRSVLQTVLDRHPGDPRIPKLVLQTYLAFGDYTNALRLLDTQRAADTNNVTLMNNEAAILIQMGWPAQAIPLLDRVLSLTNFPLARLDRASAYLQTKDLARAEDDYVHLQGSSVNPAWISLGRARIAEQRGQTNRAVQFYREFLAVTPEDNQMARQIHAHLESYAPAGK